MSLLQIVIDTDPAVWRRRDSNSIFAFDNVVDATIKLGKAFLLLNRENELRVLSAQPAKYNNGSEPIPTVLFSSDEVSDPSIEFESCFTSNVKLLVGINDRIDFMKNSDEAFLQPVSSSIETSSSSSSNSMSRGGNSMGSVVSALTRALCYINRRRTDNQTKSTIPCRVLIMQASNDHDHQFNAAMNCIFAAENHDIMIDVCLLRRGIHVLRALQQAADRTGGCYIDASLSSSSSSPPSLVPLFMFHFLPDKSQRKQWMLSSKPTQVDLGATCFCHRRAVTKTAFVCSVCLAIYCKPSGTCPTCHTTLQGSSIQSGGGLQSTNVLAEMSAGGAASKRKHEDT